MVNKTKYNYSYHINDVQLEQLYSIKDLGVNFDVQLKFSKHSDDKINKTIFILSYLGIIKRNFTYLGREAFLTLYKTCVKEHLKYVVQVCSPYIVAYI